MLCEVLQLLSDSFFSSLKTEQGRKGSAAPAGDLGYYLCKVEAANANSTLEDTITITVLR